MVLQGRDLIAAAKTGTGKTAAFSLPSMDQLPHREGNDRGPFMLIVTPTRELASQIADTCMPIGKHTHHFVGTFVGGVAYGPQIKKLERGLDVAITTPGRMIDLMERGAANLSQVQVLVLDEADRMLDMGFWPQVQRIVESTPENRQTLLFSATIDRSQDKTMFSILNDPAIVEIAHRGETADKVDQYVIKTTRRQKPELLNSFIKEKGGYRVIVFTRTKGGADNCCKRLRRIGIPAEAIHADRSQAQRSRALNNFREGKTHVLVATDVLARGIDVPEVDYVVNYDLPMLPEDYVHRIGRTGRAGADGFAVSFVTPDTRNLLRSVQKFTGQDIPEMNFEISEDAFAPIEGADERVLADDDSYFFEEKKGKGKRGGKSRGEGKFDRGRGKGGKKGARKRDLERSAEHKRKLEAEAAGEEYIPANPHHNNGDQKKRSLNERQAAADAAYAALFDSPNVEGGKKKSKKRGNDEGGYSYDSFSKKGGAKGKPGKRSRMANHDDRDLDGFRENRGGNGRMRKYDDRDNRRNDEHGNRGGWGSPRNDGYQRRESFFDDEQNSGRNSRGKKYAGKQYSDGRGGKPGKKNYGGQGSSKGRNGNFGGKGFSDRPSNGGGRPGNGNHSDGFQRSGKGGQSRNGGRNNFGGRSNGGSRNFSGNRGGKGGNRPGRGGRR